MTDTIQPDDQKKLEQAKAAVARATGREVVDKLGNIDKTAVALNVFTALLEKEGLRPALYSVLRLTDYRFISIFRFQDGKATSAVHVDRQNLSDMQAGEVDDTATYCCYVRDTGKVFVTADALADKHTSAHVAREAIRAYSGFPITDANGELIGTLCHYDTEPRDPHQLDLKLLVEVAGRLGTPGLVPPYPKAG